MRTKAGVGLLRSADAVSPVVLSGAVTLALSGADPATQSFECAETDGACKVDIKFPVKPVPFKPEGRRLLADDTYMCLRMAGSSFVAGGEANEWEAVPNADGTVTCSVGRGGTYMVAAMAKDRPTEDDVELDTFVVPPNTKPYTFTFRFVGMNYDALMANAALRAEFVSELAAAVAARLSLPASSVQVSGLRAGSVIADVTLHAPDTWTDAQIRAAAEAITSDPKSIFSAEFLAKYGITDVEATVAEGTTIPYAQGLTAGAQAGIAIGVIVAVCGAGGGGYWYWRKRRAAAAGGRPPVFDNMAGGAV